MKRIVHHSISLLGWALLMLAAGCGKNPSSASPALQKSSVVLVKTAAKLNAGASMSAIPAPGGSLNIQSALLNIEKFRIEENTGVEGGQEGGHEDRATKRTLRSDIGNPENEQEAPDIIVPGPFRFDISSGEAVLNSVAVPPGTFKKVDLTFMITAAPPLNGHAIHISGTFTPTNGAAVPVTINSKFAREIQTLIAGGGITVGANTTVSVVVTFDLAGFFKNVDFGSAQVRNGEILIDNANNTALLAAFEANLTKYVEAEEESGG